MSKFKEFMRANQKQQENEQYPATESLCDKEGKPLPWTLRAITTSENDALREKNTREVQMPGKPGVYRPKTDTTRYLLSLAVASVVEPDLYDAELQDSYGVKTPEELLQAMINRPGEYSNLIEKVQKMSGFDVTLAEKVDEAKN